MDQSAAPWPFGQAQAEQALHHGGEVHSLETGQPPGEFGVVQRRRAQTDFGQAGQILVGGVQNPFVIGEHLGDRPETRQGLPPWWTGSIGTVPAPWRRIWIR